MSDTNPNSYRETFTDCDTSSFRDFYGAVADDPCADGCPPGYTDESCVGDQQPDECGCCIDYSPIMIPLNGDQIRLSDAAGGVIFTINDVGSRVWVAWPEDAQTGLLFLDRNGDGIVTNGGELFGNTTRLRNAASAANGYVALSELDANDDARIDPSDPSYVLLRVWRDANRDGVSQLDELEGLQTASVDWLSTDFAEDGRRDRWGNRYRYRAKMSINGIPRFSYDVFPLTASIDGQNACVTRTTLLPKRAAAQQ